MKKIDYKLTLLETRNNKIFTVYIKCDINDGDYIERTTTYTGEEEFEKVLPIIKDLKYNGNNHGLEQKIYEQDEYFISLGYSEEEAQVMDLYEIIPCCVDCHSVKELNVTMEDEHGNKYKVEF